MAEETGLAKLAETVGGTLVKADDAMFNASVASLNFLPRLQLMISASKECKSGKFPINHWAVVQGQALTDAGESVDALVVSWRPKALDVKDEVISVYNIEHPEFKRIQANSAVKDSGCMFGPEFLLWLPVQEVFVTLFMGSISARREAPNIKARMNQGVTLTSQFIQTKKFEWYAPAVKPCSTPLDGPEDLEAAKQIVETFLNPPTAPEVEKVAEAGEQRAR